MALTAVWLLRLGCSGRALPVARLRQLGMVLAAAGLQLGIRLLLRLAVLLGADIPAWLLRPDGPLAAVASAAWHSDSSCRAAAASCQCGGGRCA